MKTMTDAEFEELESLRRRYRLDAIRVSAAAATLEQDIDTPIKKCVMALALLGCEPMWSCCGFDYEGQPIHKSHQGESAWVVLRDNARSRCLAERLETEALPFREYANAWKTNFALHYGDARCTLYSQLRAHNTWPNPECIHFSEPAAIAIQVLETYLLSLADEFQETVILTDTNVEFQKRFNWWQYPTKAPWVVRKVDLVPTGLERVNSHAD